MSSSGRGESESSAGSAVPSAPLYERLPRGPHRLNHAQVIRNQRARLYGAMVEAVATDGYQAASVRQVVSLAGVSRRSFYEQFANKQECFLATFDSIATPVVRRIRRAYGASEGSLEERLGAAFEALLEEIRENWNNTRLVIVDAQTVGPAGLARLRQTTATWERMLALSFAQAPDASPLAMPVVRGIVGGLHRLVAVCLLAEDLEQLPALAEDMSQWTLLFQTPAALYMATILGERLAKHTADQPADGDVDGELPEGSGVSCQDDRGRLMHHALRLALVGDYKALSAPQIAEEAGVPMERYFELFADKDECFMAALEMLGEDLLRIADDRSLAGDDWPRATRRVLKEVMRFLVERPLYAQTIAAGALAAGPEAAERNREIGHSLAAMLVQGAPEQDQSRFALEGVVGAIGHTIRCQVANGEIQMLPALSDDLAYVVLAPFIGADAAVKIVTEDPPGPEPGSG
jgi:AcrR family transcriptional regulator